ncbi:hypothetical protein DUI87_25383 [Hirundo rustica rustica]|uniref:Polypeptide N-acetylgalactosaminyltransferase n=1 Tax=Hirundo rustica rustica TaxID=333673 RepID=A0A3M0JAD7_HIRRU|nr:hypothetical protein DUI87_25383 [Hirundo rustica rustica]
MDLLALHTVTPWELGLTTIKFPGHLENIITNNLKNGSAERLLGVVSRRLRRKGISVPRLLRRCWVIRRCQGREHPPSLHEEAPPKLEDSPAEAFTDSSLFAHWGQELSPEHRRIALKQFQYYGYNAYLSDRLPWTGRCPTCGPADNLAKQELLSLKAQNCLMKVSQQVKLIKNMEKTSVTVAENKLRCRNLTFPESLPEVSVVFIFVNEALSVILRSIHSAIDRTPAHLLKEIILVDDNSNNEELKEKLQKYVDEVNAHKPGFIKVVRHSKQEGLIRSRVSGWRAATAPVVALFDAHVEFNVGWAEPVLTRIKENRKRVISPSFDNIKYDNFEIEEYPLSAQGFDWELWCRYLNPPKSWWKLENTTAPIRSPALIGCFIVDREYFQEIGLLDEGMEVYGGENVELGIRGQELDFDDPCGSLPAQHVVFYGQVFRHSARLTRLLKLSVAVVRERKVWQCGGSVEVLPCSRIAHIERAHKPYTEDLTAHVRRNALRVAEVWMDEFKSHVYMAWNIPQEDSGIDIGDISERKALRKKLQCKTFRWYLVSVYPEMRMYSDTVAYGVLQNSLKSDLCLDQGPDTENIPIMYICHGMTPQNVYYTSSQQLHVGVLSPTIDDDDNRCLVDVNSRPRLIECNYAKAKRMKLYWQFTQVILKTKQVPVVGKLKTVKFCFSKKDEFFLREKKRKNKAVRCSWARATALRGGWVWTRHYQQDIEMLECVQRRATEVVMGVEHKAEEKEGFSWEKRRLLGALLLCGKGGCDQGGPIQNRKSKRCLELQENNENEFGFQLVLQKCTGQRWSITNVLRSLSS